MTIATYFLTYADAMTLECEVIEFDTYTEAFEVYKAITVAGTQASIHDVTSEDLANEIRKSPDYTDRRASF